MLQQPGFWNDPPSRPQRLTKLLSPFGFAIGRVAILRHRFARPAPSPVPTLSIGNLTMGGHGKTPLALDIAKRLRANGVNAHLVTRGYRGREKGPHRVNPDSDDYRRVGDEPLLLATVAPTWVARDRAAGVRSAADAGADIAILDDGHQNHSISKTTALIAVDADSGFGNARVFPAGPLREPVASGLARADAVVLTGRGEFEPDTSLPVIRARFQPVSTGLTVAGARVFAFAGIAFPEKFFRTLKDLGAQLVRSESFPNHHPYPTLTILRLIRDAGSLGALLVTTEKDAVRIPQRFRTSIAVQKIEVEFEDEKVLDQILEPALEAANHRGA